MVWLAVAGLGVYDCDKGLRVWPLRRQNSSPEVGRGMKRTNSKAKSAALLGVAFDNDDGHKRLTRGQNFVLVGGSQNSHAVMQETAVKVNEKLGQRGKQLHEVSSRELVEIFQEISDR